MKEFVVEQILDGYLITAFPIAIIAGVISFLSQYIRLSSVIKNVEKNPASFPKIFKYFILKFL
jgi:hypothetical protein